MARGKRTRRRSGGGQRSFCPVIRVKCSRAHARGEVSLYKGKKAIRSRAAVFKATKARALKSLKALRGFGNVRATRSRLIMKEL